MSFQHFQDLKYFRHDVYYHVNTLVELAAAYNGVVYGEYVRNVLIPVKFLWKSLYQCDFQHVDFWFKSQSDANVFIKESCLESRNLLFGTGQYVSHFKDQRGVLINITISDTYPKGNNSTDLLSWNHNDFSVNHNGEKYPLEKIITLYNDYNNLTSESV